MRAMLHRTLSEIGKQPKVWESPDGSTALVLPYGGRILGLFTPDSETNFFWTNPALRSVDEANSLYKNATWPNSGGDRTWLSSEADFFFPVFPSPTPYLQPRQLDPGDYQLREGDSSFSLTNRFAFELCQSKRTVNLEISKYLTPADNPIQDRCSRGNISYAGFTLHTGLILENPHETELSVSLWSLLQLPHGGELLVSTFSRSAVIPYFGEVEKDDLEIANNLVRYKMRAHGKQKIGFAPASLTGRVAYLKQGEASSSLIVRNFYVNPSGNYLDLPWQVGGSTPCAVQACNINCEMGSFAELEYHSPSIGGSKGAFSLEDKSQIWAFRGDNATILEIAQILVELND
jgi:hypothetical protein